MKKQTKTENLNFFKNKTIKSANKIFGGGDEGAGDGGAKSKKPKGVIIN